ncbi:MAG: TlpA disulfide reductase family protein [Verrucomicrobiota bacterium]
MLLDFWSATADPDQRSAPALNQIAHEYAGRPFVLLGIDVGDSPEVMRAAAAKLPLASAQLAGESVAQAYDLASVPAFVLIDADGIVRARHLDWSDRSDAQLRKEIDALLVKTSARTAAPKGP